MTNQVLLDLGTRALWHSQMTRSADNWERVAARVFVSHLPTRMPDQKVGAGRFLGHAHKERWLIRFGTSRVFGLDP